MNLTITTKPPARYGEPVFLREGKIISHTEGLAAAMELLGWDRNELARQTGRDRRTVDGWVSGRTIQAASMNVLRDALDDHHGPKTYGQRAMEAAEKIALRITRSK